MTMAALLSSSSSSSSRGISGHTLQVATDVDMKPLQVVQDQNSRSPLHPYISLHGSGALVSGLTLS